MREIWLPPFNRNFTAGEPGVYIQAHGFGGPLIGNVPEDEQNRVDSGFFQTQPCTTIDHHYEDADPSPKITVDDEGNQYLVFQNSLGGEELFVGWLAPKMYDTGFASGRMYFNIDVLPPGPWTIMSLGDWGEFDPDTGVPNPDPLFAYLQVEDDGTLQWWITTDGTITTATAVGPQSVRAIEPGRWLRLEWNVLMTDGSIGDGQVSAKLFFDDVQATVPSETIEDTAVADMGSLGSWYCKMGVMGATPLPAGASFALDNLSYDVNADMPGPYMSHYDKYELGDLIYPEFEPLTENLGDPANALRTYCRALALSMQEVRDLSSDGPNGEPGWSQSLDATRVRAKWLSWLAQMVGYRPPAWQPERDDEAAYLGRQIPRMLRFSSHNRGSVDSLTYAIQEELWGKQQVNVFERDPGDNAWRMSIQVLEAEVATTAEAIYAAALRYKAAGILLPEPPVQIVPA